ncbi:MULTISPECIES: hypothetical protein [Cellulophaga]|uniref:Competence protein n=2 Tax=Cellulophaga TaxID=104264 RepID=F0RFR1_CELLC|nr:MULTISPECIES: hypothetical protein [Cellulophaga]ADY30036.1 hypothetical protein Celly_2215 [Cellulophaga lytica DSM 7489]AIM61028.1 hypothetical protein IX49_11015 [Cellulophaga lytica]APU10895.1 hypothetical protein A5M85_11555 [Cellulophaga lytica]EWH14917.1 hypothetical protein KLA_00120 [Cellulophaga geojensis KL-A]MDO6853520.1 hypothetical protein [Cellulophaga lytica]
MSVINSIDKTATEAAAAGKKYVDVSKKYYELKVFQQLTSTSSYVVKTVIIGGLLLLAFLFMAIGAALALGDLFNNIPLGYLAVGGIFILFGLLVYSRRTFIDKILIKNMSKTYFD